MAVRIPRDGELTSVGTLLATSIVLTLALYWLPAWLPFMRYVGLPLVWMATMVHELGHGFAAMLVGGTFVELKMYANGSGVAPVSGVGVGIGWAIMSAGGLCGPAVAAAIGFVVARHPKVARAYLALIGAVLLLADVIWVGNLFGSVFVGVFGAFCLFVAIRAGKQLAQLFLVFLSVQLALSVYSSRGYLFAETATTGAGTFPSDVANMATALGGPYWLWGIVCGAFSLLVLLAGAYLMFFRFRRRRRPSPRRS